MRVLHVLDHSLPMQSGYASRTRCILRAQQAAGVEVRAVTGRRHIAPGPRGETLDGIEFHRTEGGRRGPPGLRHWLEVAAQARAIDRLCEAWRPDILHAHSPPVCGEAALRVARRRSIPLVYEIRAFWEDAWVANGGGTEKSLRYRLGRAHDSRISARADAVVTICQGLSADLVARGIAPQRITVVQNGVDLASHGDPVARDGALIAGTGLGDGPVIAYIGSFFSYEGIDVLIDAMRDLLRRVPDAQLLLVGGGPCAGAVTARVAASPVKAAIRIVGPVPHAEIARFYALADVVVYPRKQGRLTELVTPLKPLEAMAHGKLVVASDVGGHRELIPAGKIATLFPPDDPAACAAALGDILTDRSSWDERRRAGRRHVEARHDWASNVGAYIDLYRQLLATKG